MRPRLRHLIEAMVAAILFLYQRVWLSFGFFTMLFPLAMLIPYIPTLIAHPERLTYERFYWRLFTTAGVLGLLIAVAGAAIFISACIHFLKGRGNLVTTGLYSIVRHPQYLGMIIAALGVSMIFMAVAGDLLLVIVGYILLAELEERHLLKEHREKYLRYKQKTPFMFPMSCPPKLNEFLFSLALAVLIFIALYLSGSLTTKVW